MCFALEFALSFILKANSIKHTGSQSGQRISWALHRLTFFSRRACVCVVVCVCVTPFELLRQIMSVFNISSLGALPFLTTFYRDRLCKESFIHLYIPLCGAFG